MTLEERCSKASILKQRFNYKDDYLMKRRKFMSFVKHNSKFWEAIKKANH